MIPKITKKWSKRVPLIGTDLFFLHFSHFRGATCQNPRDVKQNPRDVKLLGHTLVFLGPILGPKIAAKS